MVQYVHAWTYIILTILSAWFMYVVDINRIFSDFPELLLERIESFFFFNFKLAKQDINKPFIVSYGPI